MIEVRDAGDGHAVIDLTCIDLCTDGDIVAEEGRKLALVDHATGWDRGKAGRLVDRNVRLFVKPTV